MSDSVRPHRRQPTRLPHPWDSPGKNTGVGCHFLLPYVKVKLLSRVRLLATPWTAAYQAPPSVDFPGKSTRVGWRVGLPSFFSPIFCRLESVCFHLKAQLKHPPSPRKEKEMEMKKIYQFKLSSVWTLAGVSTGAEPEETKRCQGQTETQTTQGNSALYCSSREGHQPMHRSRLCGLLLNGEKEEARNQSVWTEIPSLKAEGYSQRNSELNFVKYLC